MSFTNIQQAVEQVFSQLPGTPRPEIRDDIYQTQFDALQALGEFVSDSPIRHLLTRDFQVACLGGVADLSQTTLVGGGSLASANISNLILDTIKRGKVTHPDSLEPCQPERGGTIHVDHARRDQTFGYIFYTISANSLYFKKEDGTAPSDQTVTFRASYAPTFTFFTGTSPSQQQLDQHLISIWVRLVAGQSQNA
jgi:hypothetical protein